MLPRPRLKVHTGCMNCKRRKKKCDEVKPVCDACRRLNLNCLWKNAYQEQIDSTVADQTNEAYELVFARVRAESTTIESLDMSGFKDEICLAYTLQTFFKGLNSSIDSSDSERNMWTVRSTLSFAPPEKSLAWGCILAHGLFFAGYRYRSQHLIEAALKQHGKMVNEVRAAIEDGSKRYDMDVLAAINNMGVSSGIRSTLSNLGHIDESASHVAGLLTIMRGMQPEQFQGARELALFEHLRYGHILVTLLLQKQTFLSSEAWKIVPWAKSSHPKNSFQRLVDILADLAPLQTKMHMVLPYQATEENKMTLKEQKMIGSLLAKLHDWRASIQPDLLSRVSPGTESAIADKNVKRSAPSVQFQRINDAYELANFNMILIYICRLMTIDDKVLRAVNMRAAEQWKIGTLDSQSKLAFMPITLPVNDPADRALRAAAEIMQIWEYVLDVGITGASCIFLLLPTRVARELLATTGDSRFSSLDEASGSITSFMAGEMP